MAVGTLWHYVVGLGDHDASVIDAISLLTVEAHLIMWKGLPNSLGMQLEGFNIRSSEPNQVSEAFCCILLRALLRLRLPLQPSLLKLVQDRAGRLNVHLSTRPMDQMDAASFYPPTRTKAAIITNQRDSVAYRLHLLPGRINELLQVE